MMRNLLRNLALLPGWTTRRRIVVLESDDWGGILMPSKSAYQRCLAAGYPVDTDPYTRFDSLESSEDLERLYEVLASVRDDRGRPAVLTANLLVANPDFDRIRASGFQEYAFLSNGENPELLRGWRTGMTAEVFHPQFHGREHVNVARWMRALRQRDPDTHFAFELGMVGMASKAAPELLNPHVRAFDFDDPAELEQHQIILAEGLALFRELFGYGSRSFIAPSYTWHSTLEPTLKEHGVNFLQGIPYQYLPPLAEGRRRRRHIGMRNRAGQRSLVRNGFFEPSIHAPDCEPGAEVDECLARIKLAFSWRKPAIISSHRLNYMGQLDPANRDRNLRGLKQLLQRILQTWPDVEFMTSDQLGAEISRSMQ
jgi:hypothetical protein